MRKEQFRCIGCGNLVLNDPLALCKNCEKNIEEQEKEFENRFLTTNQRGQDL